ncbi:hypothetical protein HOLleu_02412 [Holothuria leucospilota]|uniref:Uncharacterized protein n=1 Tax=Holothuria leucospilota TaxID=206669 RepID=A0A9Q1HH14_HOLLE|nr:hypothetical protein HOLleu_02412 [Holothuria leucospilota]
MAPVPPGATCECELKHSKTCHNPRHLGTTENFLKYELVINMNGICLCRSLRDKYYPRSCHAQGVGFFELFVSF